MKKQVLERMKSHSEEEEEERMERKRTKSGIDDSRVCESNVCMQERNERKNEVQICVFMLVLKIASTTCQLGWAFDRCVIRFSLFSH